MIRNAMLRMILASLTAVSAFGAIASEVIVTFPRNGAGVPLRPCIVGKVPPSTNSVWPVIHPTETDEYWVGPPATVANDGTFMSRPYFGRSGAIDEGKLYEFQVLTNPRIPISESRATPLASWPSAEGTSGVIYLTRSNDAPDGCPQAPNEVAAEAANSESVESVGPSTSMTSNREVASVPMRSTEDPERVVAKVFLWIAEALLLLLLILVILPKRAEEARTGLNRLPEGARIIVGAQERFAQGLARVGANLLKQALAFSAKCKSVPASVWARRGEIMLFIWFVIAGLTFLVANWFATYSDAHTISIALQLVFGDDSTIEESAVLAGIVPDEPEPTNKVSVPPEGVVGFIIAPFRTIWQAPHGFMAIALAALQGAFGLVLFWGKRGDIVGLGKTAARERPIPFCLFVLLDISLAILAGLRTYELAAASGALTGVYSALVGVLALAIPWIMAFTLHYGLEAIVEALSTIAAATISTVVFSSGVTWTIVVVASELLLRLVLLILQTASLCIVMATYGFVWGFLWLAQLVNEAIAEIAAQLARGWRHLFPVSGSSAVTGLPSAVVKAMLVIFVVGVLLLMQSCATTEPVGVVHASAIQETTSLPVHDNAAPYTAWVLCVDTSTSVRDDQFTKLQAILEQTLQSKLKNNDIVWLVDMGSAKSLAQSIYVPALPRQQGPRPLDAVSRQAAERALAAAIDEIRRAIQSLERSAVNTNLIDRIALAMGILRDHPSATKVLLIGSDFIDDRGVPTATPPSNSLGLSGKGVYALLFAARPTTRALKDIGLSEVRLEQVVRTEWSAYFKSLNAQAVSVQLADSIPTSPNLGN